MRFTAIVVCVLCIAALCGPRADAQQSGAANGECALPADVAASPLYFVTDRPENPVDPAEVDFSDDRPLLDRLIGDKDHPYSTKHPTSYGTVSVDGAKVHVTKRFGDKEHDGLPPFIAELKALQSSPDVDVVLYVHGYNTTFKGAAASLAHMRAMLACATGNKRRIVPVFFTWPSSGHLGKPMDDEVRAEWANEDFTALIDALAPLRPYAVAHSMGNRFLINAINRCGVSSGCFAHVAFVAPDVDAHLFADILASHIGASATGYTLYVSSRDNAMWLSERGHGESRAGEAGTEMLLFASPVVTTIDASYIQAGSRCHGYIDERTTLYDIARAFYGTANVAQAPTRFATVRPGGTPYYEIIDDPTGRSKTPCTSARHR